MVNSYQFYLIPLPFLLNYINMQTFEQINSTYLLFYTFVEAFKFFKRNKCQTVKPINLKIMDGKKVNYYHIFNELKLENLNSIYIKIK